MKPKKFAEQAECDATIVVAIHLARYTLLRHHLRAVRTSGGEFRMDFQLEIDKLTEALELLGIDMPNGPRTSN